MKLIRDAISNKSAANLAEIQQVIHATKALDYCYAQVKQFALKAIAALKDLPASNYKTALQQLAEFSYQRGY